MKSFLKLIALSTLFVFASCAHHKSCDMHAKSGCGQSKESCKECCKGGQCDMKSHAKGEAKAESTEAPKK